MTLTHICIVSAWVEGGKLASIQVANNSTLKAVKKNTEKLTHLLICIAPAGAKDGKVASN